jgi:hypothetical protein
MATRLPIPALFSMAAAVLLMLPYAPVTQSASKPSEDEYAGANSFHCKLNGAIFDNDSVKGTLAHDMNSFYLNLSLDNKESKHLTFVLRDAEIRQRAYELNSSNERYLTFNFEGVVCLQSSDEIHSGILMIHKYDTLHKIIAGSFEFMTYSDQCEEMIYVNEGSFDVRYQELSIFN